ncbi:MAG: glycoside hydrolase family 1 protein [Clostridiaceae bacterium]|nr:glycoside hydrolase family 1 protein [Clostridiaceae bacterium]
MEKLEPFFFDRPFGLGTATAPTQIEGYETDNSWYDWAEIPGKIADGSSPLRANEHWVRWKADIDLMAKMGIRYYRLGLEWSRIEPEEGKFDESAVARYREELLYLRKKEIRPLITLHHFSNPSWFEARGAFCSANGSGVFLRYVRYIVTKIEDLCSEYVTLNEPNVYAANGYLFGLWPPGVRSFIRSVSVMSRLAGCHIQAYRIIHEIYENRAVHVGFANHYRIFRAPSEGFLAQIGIKWIEYLFQDGITRFMITGRFSFPFGLPFTFRKGTYCDFIGINYYTRCTMKGLTELPAPPHSDKNDLGWEIYPDGIRMTVQKYYNRYPLPVFITENGTADASDTFRARFLYDHLRTLALDCPYVSRYYHWTFIDNFEWAEGETARFGLVENDFPTQRRTIRQSGRFYSEIIKNNGVTDPMIQEYFPVRDTSETRGADEKD